MPVCLEGSILSFPCRHQAPGALYWTVRNNHSVPFAERGQWASLEHNRCQLPLKHDVEVTASVFSAQFGSPPYTTSSRAQRVNELFQVGQGRNEVYAIICEWKMSGRVGRDIRSSTLLLPPWGRPCDLAPCMEWKPNRTEQRRTGSPTEGGAYISLVASRYAGVHQSNRCMRQTST
jgi:hypothetical protein